MSYSNTKKIESFVKTVTTAGTREPLAAGAKELMEVQALTIKALSTNGGLVYIGDTTVSNAIYYSLSAGQTLSFMLDSQEWQRGAVFNLNKIYIDAAVNGEGVCVVTVKD